MHFQETDHFTSNHKEMTTYNTVSIVKHFNTRAINGNLEMVNVRKWKMLGTYGVLRQLFLGFKYRRVGPIMETTNNKRQSEGRV